MQQQATQADQGGQHGRPGRQDEWAEGGLYKTVLGFLPVYRTRRDKLDVRRLGRHPDLLKSPEAIYKWFRRDRFNSDNARALIRIAGSPENIAALRRAGRQPPTLSDFINFV